MASHACQSGRGSPAIRRASSTVARQSARTRRGQLMRTRTAGSPSSVLSSSSSSGAAAALATGAQRARMRRTSARTVSSRAQSIHAVSFSGVATSTRTRACVQEIVPVSNARASAGSASSFIAMRAVLCSSRDGEPEAFAGVIAEPGKREPVVTFRAEKRRRDAAEHAPTRRLLAREHAEIPIEEERAVASSEKGETASRPRGPRPRGRRLCTPRRCGVPGLRGACRLFRAAETTSASPGRSNPRRASRRRRRRARS